MRRQPGRPRIAAPNPGHRAVTLRVGNCRGLRSAARVDVGRLPALGGSIHRGGYNLIVEASSRIVLGDQPGGRPEVVCRLLWRVTAITCRELLSIGQLDNEALEALVVQLFARPVLHTNAPGNDFLSHELTAENADRTASHGPRHHVGGDKQRPASLRLGGRHHAEADEQRQSKRSCWCHPSPPLSVGILPPVVATGENEASAQTQTVDSLFVRSLACPATHTLGNLG